MEINCPQCGADFQLEEPDIFINCEFCKNSLFIDIDKITAVYTFEPAIKSNQLSSYLKKDFEKIGFNKDIDLVNSTPVYFPFWQIGSEKKLVKGSHLFPAEKIESLSVYPRMAGLNSKNRITMLKNRLWEYIVVQ